MNIKKYLPIIGISIFIYILLKLDMSNIFEEISNVNIKFLLIAVLIVFISLITQTLKWFYIARVQATSIPFFKSFKINMISLFYGFITPSRIGGVVRAEYLRKYNDNKVGKGVGNFVLDKVLDLCSLIFLAVVFSFVFKEVLPTNYLYYAILVFVLIIITLIIFRNKERSRSILRIFYKKFAPEKFKNKLKNEFYSFYDDMPKKRYLVLFLNFSGTNFL